jgi:hypothetical protein
MRRVAEVGQAIVFRGLSSQRLAGASTSMKNSQWRGPSREHPDRRRRRFCDAGIDLQAAMAQAVATQGQRVHA